jgi:SET domain-containing protein
MRINPPTKIYVDRSPIHGWGVFASENIKEGEVLEICPFVDMGMTRGETSPVLIDYRFNWPQGVEWEKQVIGLGFSSLYNHSNDANANWRSIHEENVFEFYATRDISAGEEIFVWYGGVEYWNDGRSNVKIV